MQAVEKNILENRRITYAEVERKQDIRSAELQTITHDQLSLHERSSRLVCRINSKMWIGEMLWWVNSTLARKKTLLINWWTTKHGCITTTLNLPSIFPWLRTCWLFLVTKIKRKVIWEQGKCSGCLSTYH